MPEAANASDTAVTPEGARGAVPGGERWPLAAWCRARPVGATTAALAVFFLLRLAAGAFTIGRGVFLCTDGEDYHELAANLAAGRGYLVDRVRWFEPPRPVPASDYFRPPLLPLALAVPYAILPDSLWVAACLAAAVGTAGALACALLARRLWGERSFAPVLALAGAWPVFVFYSAFLSTEAPMILALAALVLAMVALARDADAPPRRLAWRSALAGLALGLSALVRPSMLVGFGLVPLWAWLALGCPRARRGLAAGVVLAAACATVAPWTARNYVSSGEFISVTSFGGYTFWLGNNEANLRAYSSAGYAGFLEHQRRALGPETRRLTREMARAHVESPGEQERFWLAEARGFVAEHPFGFAYLIAMRLGHFFRPWLNPAAYGWGVALLSLAAWSALYAAGAAGFARLWRRERAAALAVAAVVASGALAHALTHVMVRHRVPFVDTAAVVLAAPVVADWAKAVWARLTGGRAAARPDAVPAPAGDVGARP